MALTDTQRTALTTDISGNTDPIILQAIADGNTGVIADWYNGTASPDFWILKRDVGVDAIVGAMDWATDYTAFKDDINAIRFLLDNGTYDPQPVGAREALNEVFSGAAATKSNVLSAATRLATYAEKLFAVTTTGPGGGDGSSQGASAIAEFIGNITFQDVILP